jgi:adenylate cyclase
MASFRRLTAILAADVAGYSRLMGADEEGTHERLKAHLAQLIEPKIKEHRGRTVKNTGDGLLAEFPSVVDAVRSAVEVQCGMRSATRLSRPASGSSSVSASISATLLFEDGDIHGDGVNIAARLEGIAEPGGICISEDAYRQVRGKVDAEFVDIGEQSLKNIARVRVFRISLGERLASPVPPVLTLTKASSLPEEFALQSIMGTEIRAYTVDAKFLHLPIQLEQAAPPASAGFPRQLRNLL